MAFEITDYVKMTINKFGFDEDEILETIENYEDIVRKDNIVLYKKQTIIPYRRGCSRHLIKIFWINIVPFFLWK